MDPRCRILVQGPFDEGEVRAEITAERRPSTPELDAHIDERWEEARGLARDAGRTLFDGAVLRWVDHAVPRGDDGRPRLELRLGRGVYREFVGTNLDPTLKPDIAGGSLPWRRFGNAIGTSAIVVTDDRRLVMGRRSARVLGYAGHVHSFGGMLEGVDVAPAGPPGSRDALGTVDVFASMRRELAEELALAPAEMRDLVLTGVMIEPEIHQPELLFRVRIPLAAAALPERWRRAESRDEHEELIVLPDDEAAMEEALVPVAPVSPIGRACLALHFATGERR
jgi:8-oxo-dGTP pyrophosphatase MutT (NUDIX family)